MREKPSPAVHRCDHEVWEDPYDNLRVIGLLPRTSKKWKRLYMCRMSIERIFRSLKHSRGIRKITLQATLSVLTYQATVLARLKVGDTDRMRRMSVQVA